MRTIMQANLCRRCGMEVVDSTRKHCAFCILRWLAVRLETHRFKLALRKVLGADNVH